MNFMVVTNLLVELCGKFLLILSFLKHHIGLSFACKLSSRKDWGQNK